MVNTPIPSSLKSEARKAAKILRDFSIPSAKTGPDRIIPTGLLVNAEGLAILTVAKIGFLLTARGGSGIVIAKLNSGAWSAPSAIGIAGLGGGFEIGAEVTDFVIILNKRAAVEAFSKGGNLTLGGNFTVAAGPMGRNVEGDISLRSPAAMYTYSKTKGLFAGISIEGSALIERKDANKKFYFEDIRAVDILSGGVPPPDSCSELYDVLDQHKEILAKMVLATAKREAVRQIHKARDGTGILQRVRSLRMPKRKSSRSSRTSLESHSDNEDDLQGASSQRRAPFTRSTSSLMAPERPKLAPKPAHRKSTSSLSQPLTRQKTAPPGRPAAPVPAQRASLRQSASFDDAWDRPAVAKALYAFAGEMPCDLQFETGDEIEILTRTATQEDWWEGRLRGRVGIFPANYVQVS